MTHGSFRAEGTRCSLLCSGCLTCVFAAPYCCQPVALSPDWQPPRAAGSDVPGARRRVPGESSADEHGDESARGQRRRDAAPHHRSKIVTRSVIRTGSLCGNHRPLQGLRQGSPIPRPLTDGQFSSFALAVGRSEGDVRELVKPQKRPGGFTRLRYLTYATKAKTNVKAIECPTTDASGGASPHTSSCSPKSRPADTPYLHTLPPHPCDTRHLGPLPVPHRLPRVLDQPRARRQPPRRVPDPPSQGRPGPPVVPAR